MSLLLACLITSSAILESIPRIMVIQFPPVLISSFTSFVPVIGTTRALPVPAFRTFSTASLNAAMLSPFWMLVFKYICLTIRLGVFHG